MIGSPHRDRSGWWIEIAQHVAPKRFQENERRRSEAENLQLAMACDLPIYGLVDERQGSRDVTSGFWQASLGPGRRKARRVRIDSAVVHEITAAHASSDGGRISVTTYRGGGHNDAETERARLLNNFLNSSLEPDDVLEADRVDHRESRRSFRLRTATPGAEWLGFEVLVDGELKHFDRLNVPGH